LKLSDFKTVGTWRLQGCQPYAPANFTPQKIFLVLISVRVWVDTKAIAMQKASYIILREENRYNWKKTRKYILPPYSTRVADSFCEVGWPASLGIHRSVLPFPHFWRIRKRFVTISHRGSQNICWRTCVLSLSWSTLL
jgi:hypothetical protein